MNLDPDDLKTYTYELPEALIATHPPEQRDGARLMVLDRATRTIAHRSITDLPDLLQPGDCLVLNDTRVVPARVVGTRSATGGKWEGLFLKTFEDGAWQLMGQTRGKLLPGETVTLSSIHRGEDEPPLQLVLESRDDEGLWKARPQSDESVFELLERYGTVPLPPYMHRKVADDNDWSRYQTTFANTPGSVAAPTAGLHFTPELLERCQARGINNARVTLHVGIGTFKPISVERLSDHNMHSEWCCLSQASADVLNQTRAAGGRIVSVGTTSVRTLESAIAASDGSFQEFSGETRLFIRPPYEFQAIDCLLTNFHLPESTLLVLVSTLAGTGFVLDAYRQAVAERYRFFSYGDAMLIL